MNTNAVKTTVTPAEAFGLEGDEKPEVNEEDGTPSLDSDEEVVSEVEETEDVLEEETFEL